MGKEVKIKRQPLNMIMVKMSEYNNYRAIFHQLYALETATGIEDELIFIRHHFVA